MFVMFISVWKMLEWSGNCSRKALRVWGLISRMSSSMFPWVPESKKFLRFRWKGKLFQWQVLPFGLKCSQRILIFIIKFLHGRGISLTDLMKDFTNQARCRCKAIFQIHVIALVFMCCSWPINWVKTILEPTGIPLHLGFLWDTLWKTITLPKDKTTQVEDWA